MVFNAIFNISVIYRVDITRVPGENHWPAANHWQTLSHNFVSSTCTPVFSGYSGYIYPVYNWNIENGIKHHYPNPTLKYK
jgi:hypothetical protein